MNFIVISPYYPENFQPFTIELAKKGINVLGIGQEPYEQLGPDLQGALTEYFRVENLEDIDEVKRAVAFLFYKHGPIDRIESHNEYWLENDAVLREQFHIFGAKPNHLRKTKFKSKMKKYFAEAGVPVVPGQVIKTEKDITRSLKKIGLPLIAKPDNGVGAAATYKLTSQADVEHFIDQWDRETVYFFEKFVNSSEICTYDGLVDRNGKIVFETTFDYHYTPLELLESQKDNAYYILKTIDPKLQAYGRAIVKAFGMRERFFHIEFFREGDDYIAIEYNNRPAGGFTVDVYNFAHSIDLYRDYASIVAGEEVAKRTFEPQYCLAITRRDTTQYVHSEEDLRSRYAGQLKMEKRMPCAFAALQGDTIYILTTDNRTELEEMIAYISQTHS
ncbi:ATP-grasp domain-containing protein [Streptococcus cuniculi]|uniref:Carbamoyl phosphate synthase large subunit n=1 Tax=Streptococcus cuniculi TaxID=1432788 RepID=A0A4Y9JFK0_9STRE|nr:carbamoyl phosphate synthase large subunit [Streptococcus cuniculi]MBF0777572.1 carbamoyl phosphate synthase large subunit [Streptococcus cuniculi]TFU98615.1 carbamoyl phosphate synthase large subunit [Streptococcus cuniculi]